MRFQKAKFAIFRLNSHQIFILLLLLIKLAMTDQQNSIVGGWTEQNVNDENIKSLASRSVAKINAESNDRFSLFPVEVLSAKSQVVAGIQYQLRIKVGRSNCSKNQPTLTEHANCETEDDQTARKTFLVTIWEKPWEQFEQITYQLE
ncbi:hypothetical protein niasHT_005463 [Heterodera trifolii]|uniref:Cystatin domain-containing protein n=1 Tax=Heterodera trifolii TaxID=157864 RepID=A0ABD2M5E7_9BILA